MSRGGWLFFFAAVFIHAPANAVDCTTQFIDGQVVSPGEFSAIGTPLETCPSGGEKKDKTGNKVVLDDVNSHLKGGDNEGALQTIRGAMERDPENKTFQDVAKLLESHAPKLNMAKVTAQVKNFLPPPPPVDDMPRGKGPPLLPQSALEGASPQNPTGPRPPSVAARPSGGESYSAPMTQILRDAKAPAAPPAPAVTQALTKLRMNDAQGAEALLSQHLAQRPADIQALRLRGLLRFQQGRYDEAIGDARLVLAAAPGDSRARRLLVDSLGAAGRNQEALVEAGIGLELSPNDPELYAARARIWEALGKRAEQLADLKRAVALDSQFDELYKRALKSVAAPPPSALGRSARVVAIWLGAAGTALSFFSFVLYRGRGDTTRKQMPTEVPQGFRVVRTLGRGGMGVVYEAEDLALQRTVAIKKMLAEVADNPRERARFLKEARTVAALKHPNIVEIYAVRDDGDGLFLVFEHIAGEDLHQKLGRGALAPAQALAWLAQIASALDYAHSRGVVHQDLKPANIMVAANTAKVMDFGIARRVQETLSTLSRGEIFGTPVYMAPEQERGGAVGPAADIFALGACAYELLSGRPPFPNGSLEAKLGKRYAPLTGPFDPVVAKALDPDPAARWPNAAAFVDALAKAAA